MTYAKLGYNAYKFHLLDCARALIKVGRWRDARELIARAMG